MADWAPGVPGLSDAGREFDRRLRERLADDLDLPGALVVLNEAVSSDLPTGERYALLASWDSVLGLDLERDAREGWEPTGDMNVLVSERDVARAAKDFATADLLRERLQAMGLEVMDTPEGTKIRPKVA
jgi:cysteinyl-tRNA synthetase